MRHTIRFEKKAWSVIVAGFILASLLGQSLMPASVSVAQWETSTSTVPVQLSATVTPTPQLPQEPLITIIPIFTSTRTPTPISLGNFVWDDLDADGVQDAGEPGVEGVTVQLWNSALTELLDSDLTSVSGLYTLVAPIPGNYRIRVLLNAGDQYTIKDQGGDDTRDSDINSTGSYYSFTDIIIIDPNVISITSLDAGILVFKTPTPTRTPTPINLGNFIWRDSDADGIQDAGEIGVPYVTVQLWDSTKSQLIDTDVTNESGIYWLIAPHSGDYRIRVLLPVAEAEFSPQYQGGDTTKDSNVNPSGENLGFTDIIFIAPNVISISSLDAGMINLPPVLPTPTPTQLPLIWLYLPVILK
jgi:hypothetical protein